MAVLKIEVDTSRLTLLKQLLIINYNKNLILQRSHIWKKNKKKWKCVIFKCYSSEELITLNTLHEVVPTWYSFHSWVDWSNADKVSCSRRKHIDAEVRTRDLCIQNRHSNHYTNCFIQITFLDCFTLGRGVLIRFSGCSVPALPS